MLLVGVAVLTFSSLVNSHLVVSFVICHLPVGRCIGILIFWLLYPRLASWFDQQCCFICCRLIESTNGQSYYNSTTRNTDYRWSHTYNKIAYLMTLESLFTIIELLKKLPLWALWDCIRQNSTERQINGAISLGTDVKKLYLLISSKSSYLVNVFNDTGCVIYICRAFYKIGHR